MVYICKGLMCDHLPVMLHDWWMPYHLISLLVICKFEFCPLFALNEFLCTCNLSALMKACVLKTLWQNKQDYFCWFAGIYCSKNTFAFSFHTLCWFSTLQQNICKGSANTKNPTMGKIILAIFFIRMSLRKLHTDVRRRLGQFTPWVKVLHGHKHCSSVTNCTFHTS